MENDNLPLPLQRKIALPEDFPIHALGPILSAAVQSLLYGIQAPDALCAQSVLAAATLACQCLRNIEIDGRVSPLSLYFISIASSGERKSATDNVVLARIHEYQRSKWKAYEIEKATYDRTLEDRRNRDRKSNPGKPPIVPMILMDEPTYEGTIKTFHGGQAGMGIFSSEGGRIVGGHSMKNEEQLKTAAGYSELWDGKPITRVRAGEPPIVLYGRRLSIHIMLQPKAAHLLLGNETLKDQGLLSRCLASYPASTMGSRFYKEVDLTKDPGVLAFNERVSFLMQKDKPLADGAANELDPKSLTLRPEAKALYIEMHDVIERQVRPDGLYSRVAGFANKAAEHAVRLAGVLTLFHDPDATEVGVECFSGAKKIIEFYLKETLRLSDAALIDRDLALAENVLKWIKARGIGKVQLKEIYQNGPTEIRKAERARQIMASLESHNYVYRLDGTDTWVLREFL